jgi:hypothetical protein
MYEIPTTSTQNYTPQKFNIEFEHEYFSPNAQGKSHTFKGDNFKC